MFILKIIIFVYKNKSYISYSFDLYMNDRYASH